MERLIAFGMVGIVVLAAGMITRTFAQMPPQIAISMTEYAFTGPEGKSGPIDAAAVNIATLKTGQTVQLVVSNDGMNTHTIVSPLFDAVAGTEIQFVDAMGTQVARSIGKSNRTIELRPGWKARVVLTPSFETSEDNGKVVFEVTCHRQHGTPNDHYLRGMKATITVSK